MAFLDFLQPGGETPQAQVPPPAVPEQQAPEISSVVAPNQPNAGGFSFLEKLKTDPAFTQAALMMGARMMQGPRVGQDAAGAVGDAVMMGTQAYTMGKQNQLENQRAGERAAVVNAQTQAQTEQTQANTEGVKLTNAENQAMSPQRIKQMKLKIQALERSDNVEAARATYDRLKADFLSKKAADPNGNIEQIWNDELSSGLLESQSKRNLQAAQAGYYTAAGEHQRGQGKLAQEQADHPEKFAKGGTGAMVQSREQLKQMYREANPGVDDKTLNQMVIDHETTAKRKATTEFFVKFATDAGYDMSNPKQAEKAKAAYQNTLRIADELHGGGKGAGGSFPSTPAAPGKATPAVAEAPIPLPASAADAVVGQAYKVGGRTQYWDGAKFVDKKPGK